MKMKYEHGGAKLESPESALALGSYQASDAAIYDRLRKLTSYRGQAPAASEVRRILDKEMGGQSLSGTLRALRDED